MIEHLRACAPGAPVRARPGTRGTAVPLETCVRVRASGAPVVAVFGELDLATAKVFRDVVNRAVHRYGPDVVIDAAGITFCDACGVGALVHAANDAHAAGGTLTLVASPPHLTRLLRLVGLYERFSSVTAPREPASIGGVRR